MNSSRITCGLSCERPKAVEKGQCISSVSTGLSPTEWMHLKDIFLRSWLVHSKLSVLENTEAQRTATLVTWIAGTLDSLVIKACTVIVLMLFLTSKAPLPVTLSKVIIQNVVRSWFDKSLASGTSGVLALCSPVGREPIPSHNSSHVQFLSGGWGCFPPQGLCSGHAALWKKIKVFRMYYAYLKCDNPLVNKKEMIYFLIMKLFFSKFFLLYYFISSSLKT